MKDTDPMPYGKHQGIAMANVPAEYLLWLYKEKKASKPVKQYIEDNMDVLKKEVKK